jgi:hypothetical protein
MSDPVERKIRSAIARSGVPREVVEKDYAIGHVLAALYTHPLLRDQLVFKGGTALRKAHFPGYRFSEDLDFSAAEGERDLEAFILEAAKVAERSLLEQGPFGVSLTRYPAGRPHVGGQQAFRLHVRFPWQSQALCSLKLEITTDEPVLKTPLRLPLLHGYDEPLEGELTCYTLEEVVAEKLRALLQTRAHLAERGWARPRSRDYYDLWQLLCAREDAVDIEEAALLLPAKCQVRDVGFAGVEDFFSETTLQHARADWSGSLGRMVAELPDFDVCVSDLQGPVGDLVEHAIEHSLRKSGQARSATGSAGVERPSPGSG